MDLTEQQRQACLDAADYIAKYGHYKGTNFKGGVEWTLPVENVPACALGALAKVGGLEAFGVDMFSLARVGVILQPDDGLLLQDFNDDSDTTAEDVILVLKRFGTEL